MKYQEYILLGITTGYLIYRIKGAFILGIIGVTIGTYKKFTTTTQNTTIKQT